jgi:hypothetical protein
MGSWHERTVNGTRQVVWTDEDPNEPEVEVATRRTDYLNPVSRLYARAQEPEPA